MINRTLNLVNLLKNKSFFLFGPRATGKSSLIRKALKDDALIIDLLKSDNYLRYSSQPGLVVELIEQHSDKKYIVIDEIQRIPELLNEVHWLIEERQLTFLLTGSSARKLKQKDTNLLAGRAWQAELFPLTYHELDDFDLNRYLHVGGLPPVYLSEQPEEELNAYVYTYLEEEIQREALVRKLPSFTRFLLSSALSSGEIINFTKVANDSAVSANTIRGYYQILSDTLVGFMLPAYTAVAKRKAISTAKFYYFDIGVRNSIANINSIPEKTSLYGNAFEHFIAMELRAYLSYKRIRKTLAFWCSTNHVEVDFVIGDEVAVEVKASNNIQKTDLKGLKLLKEEGIFQRYIVVSQDSLTRKQGAFEIMHWQHFLDALWAGEII
jgi:predicted AAA+ superfamily ATPase